MYRQNQPISGVESKVYRFIKNNKLICHGEHILLGVSGGPDSIAMVHILLRLQTLLGVSRYSVLHVNHGIRPESEEEENFVVCSMRELGIAEVIVERFDVPFISRRKGLSLEMAARLCRHEALEHSRNRLQAHKIALAHHGNDQAEELLLRLFRGSSLEGFEGMRPMERDRRIIRPLLCLSRQEILSYLEERSLHYVEDSSNTMPCFQRNRVRLELIPLAEDIFKRPVVNILNRFTDIATQENDYWEREIAKAWSEICLEEIGGKVVIDSGKFALLHPALQRRIVRHIFTRIRKTSYGVFYGHVEAVRKLMLESQSGHRLRIAGIEIFKEWVRTIFETGACKRQISKREMLKSLPACLSTPERLPIPGKWSGSLPDGIPLLIETSIYPYEGQPVVLNHDHGYFAVMDYDSLKLPLHVRTWRPGDRFEPLGMEGHSRKLKNFFSDLKVPRNSRYSIPLIVDREKICWVVGYRLSERVKVTSETKEILEIRVTVR